MAIADKPVTDNATTGNATADQATTDKATTGRATLVVDIDGTLLRTDLLFEGVAALARTRPWLLFLLPVWLLAGGKAHMKRCLARHVDLAVDDLPVDDVFIGWLREQKAMGRRLVLFSAADHGLVARVAARFGCFDMAYGSDGRINLAGAAKLAAIRGHCGDDAAYAGDSRTDLPIWAGLGRAVLVGRQTTALQAALPPTVTVEAVFPTPAPSPGTWVRALRLHQWAKNGLIFVAPLLAGVIAQPPAALAALLAFVVFGLLASATYLLNDLLDLPADRRHRTKRWRPLAAGTLPLAHGMVAMVGLTAVTAGLAALLPLPFALAALLYLTGTLLYSWRLKREPVLDMLILAGLFTLRIVAGAAAASTALTSWLLTFSMFFFLSLAAIKRYTECRAAAGDGRRAVDGRGYRPDDALWLLVMGGASGFCSTLVFFIYLVDSASPMRNYPNPHWLWLICVILAYWLNRVWLLASRGEMNDDPVLFAVKDRLSLALGCAVAVIVLLARF